MWGLYFFFTGTIQGDGGKKFFWVKMLKFQCYWVKMLNLLVKLGSCKTV